MPTLRLVCRTLLRDPQYVAAFVSTVAIAVALNGAIVGLVRTSILDPRPFPTADRAFAIKWGVQASTSVDEAVFEALQTQVPALEGVVAYQWARFAIDALGARHEVIGAYVSPDLFDRLGVAPTLGRLPGPHAQFDAVISHALWARTFAGRPSAVGSTLLVNGVAVVVVGVMPSGFNFPARQDVWMPMAARRATGADQAMPFFALGFARRGADGATIDRQLATVHIGGGAAAPDRVLRAVPFRESVVSSEARTMALLLLATGVCLAALGAGNTAALTAAREITRLRERAVQRALGASVERIAVEIAVSVVVVSLLGLALGAALALQLLDFSRARFGAQFPYWQTFEPGWIGAAFCVLLAAAFALVAIGAALLQLRKQSPSDGLREGTRSRRDAPAAVLRRRIVVYAQVSFAVAVLIVTTRLVQSAWEYVRRSPGFDSSKVLAIRLVNVPTADDPSRDPLARVIGAVEQIRALPGVLSASIASSAPATGSARSASIRLRSASGDSAGRPAIATGVGRDFFDVLGVRMVAGRAIRDDDASEGALANVVVNRTFVSKYLGDQDALGATFAIERSTDTMQVLVVGVSPDVSDLLVSEPVAPAVYLPLARLDAPTMYVMVRAASREMMTGLLPRVETMLRGELRQTTVARRASVDDLRRELFAQESLLAVLAVALAGAAASLAAIGIYSLVRLTVARERHAAAVKIALGANPSRVGVDLFREVTILGAAAALSGAWLAHLAAGVLQFLFFGVAVEGVAAYAGTTTAAMLSILLMATQGWLHLARVDPASTLR